ncbi:MAG: aspartate aminotransferase family protein [Chloroherpetonaceae bacterium]|nr:aspartate aminotransferase family protein [Chloroherpetonaceae bacterium]
MIEMEIDASSVVLTSDALTLEKESDLFFHTYSRLPLAIEKGKGAYLYTKSGEKYLDMIAGIGVNALGYGNPKIIKAITDQTKKYIHTSNLFLLEPQFRLADKLIELTGLSKVFFSNSGAEANDGAIKLARKWATQFSPIKSDHKTEVLSLTNGFHGRTYGALTLTPKAKYHEGFYPLLPSTGTIQFNDGEDLRAKVSDKTAAVFVEFVQGEGGICALQKSFVELLFELSVKHHFLIVADEVQAGCGRTGDFFSYMNFGVTPDIVTAAKPLGGGLPLGAIIGGKRVEEAFTKGSHGTTFGGNPVAAAAGLALIEEMLEKNLMTQAKEVGAYFKWKLDEMRRNHLQITAIRQIGLMIGISVSRDASYYVQKALKQGLIINATNTNVIRLLPPLIISKKEVDQAVKILDKIFKGEWLEGLTESAK